MGMMRRLEVGAKWTDFWCFGRLRRCRFGAGVWQSSSSSLNEAASALDDNAERER